MDRIIFALSMAQAKAAKYPDYSNEFIEAYRDARLVSENEVRSGSAIGFIFCKLIYRMEAYNYILNGDPNQKLNPYDPVVINYIDAKIALLQPYFEANANNDDVAARDFLLKSKVSKFTDIVKDVEN